MSPVSRHRRPEWPAALCGHDGTDLKGAPRAFDAQRGHANRQIGRRPPPDLSAHEARCVGHVSGHAHIDHNHRGSDVGGQDSSPPRHPQAEVGDHLCGDLGGPRRHPLGQHPVVTGEDGDHGGLRDRRRRGTGNGGQLGPYSLEPPERSRVAWSAGPGGPGPWLRHQCRWDGRVSTASSNTGASADTRLFARLRLDSTRSSSSLQPGAPHGTVG